MNYYAYIHLTKDTGEIFYIGKGKGNRAYSRRARNNYWKNIVEKHGYIVEIIKQNMTEEQAFRTEIELIQLYKPKANLTSGGQGVSGYKHDPELVKWRNAHNKAINKTYEGKLKKSIAQKEAQNRPEVKKKVKEGLKRFKNKIKIGLIENPYKGPRWSEEQKKEISYRQRGEKGYWYGKTTAVAKPVINIDNGIVFQSLKEAAKAVNGSYRGLSKAIKANKRFKKVRFAWHKAQ